MVYKKISKKLKYNSEYLDSKIPDECKYLWNPDWDYPFLVINNVLPDNICDWIMDKLTKASKDSFAEISSWSNSDKVNKNVRNTHWLRLDEFDREHYDNWMKKAKEEINKFFWLELKNSEWLSVLGYEAWGHYKLHSDNCCPLFDKEWTFIGWEHTRKTRKITTIVFLWDSTINSNSNTEFLWWNVSFDYLIDENNKPFLFSPKKWMLLAFPSNPYFSHTVHKVLDWYRVSLVEWFDADMK